jgi:uncharacterized protein (TIGR03437 family)
MSQTRIQKSLKMFFSAGLLVAAALGIQFSKSVIANSNGSMAALTNAPGEKNCTSCHDTTIMNTGFGKLELLGLPEQFVPGAEYQLTVKLTETQRSRYGFQMTVLDEAGKSAGEVTVTDTLRTQKLASVVGGIDRFYLGQTQYGFLQTETGATTWSFKWTAPLNNQNNAKFYLVGTAGNGDRTSQGDHIYSKVITLSPAAVPVTSVSAASFDGSKPIAPEAIVAGFGAALGTATAAAEGDADPNIPGIQLPETLAGTSVKIKDSTGIERNAPLFFVSPAQVNYLMPVGTASGEAQVTVTSANGSISTGVVQVERVSPAIFAADASGNGAAAALVLRVRANGSQTYEATAVFNGNQWVTAPIDPGESADQLFLVIFGTGFRNRVAGSVSAKIGEATPEILFAGSQGSLAGLDQANVRLPRTGLVRGQDIAVSLSAEGRESNTVRIQIRQ